MADLPVKRPTAALRAATDIIVPNASAGADGSRVQFIIRIDTNRLVARDFAAFLELIDHVYGRSSSADFRSYALRSHGHFTFTTSRHGSWELVAEKVLGVAAGLEPLIVLWLVLKYLPSALHSFGSAYNQYQQGQLARIKRQRIREQMENDRDLESLSKLHRAELARLVDGISEKEGHLMPRVHRFFRRSYLGVRLEITKHKERNGAE